MIIFGVNPVVEALRAGTVSRLWVKAGAGARLARVVEQARRAGVAAAHVESAELDRLAPGAAHQGMAAEVAGARRRTVRDLIDAALSAPLLVVLDGVEDPRNFGAVARAAEAAGADGLIFPTRRSALPGATAAKASAGALAHLRLAPVVNVGRALAELGRAGVWTVGLDAEAERSCFDLDLTQPTAFVVGAEGRGLRRLVRERCDHLASIPLRGRVSSLNVSVAAGVALFEAVRQRTAQAGPARRGGRGGAAAAAREAREE